MRENFLGMGAFFYNNKIVDHPCKQHGRAYIGELDDLVKEV